jgi:hypothetical protein
MVSPRSLQDLSLDEHADRLLEEEGIPVGLLDQNFDEGISLQSFSEQGCQQFGGTLA